MSDIAQRLGRLEASPEELKSLENWLDQRPDQATKDKWLRVAVANHKLRVGDVGGARLLFDHLLDEKDLQIILGKWKCCMAEKDFSEAERLMQTAMGMEDAPNWIDNLYAKTLYCQGKIKEARQFVRKNKANHKEYFEQAKNIPGADGLRFDHIVIVSYGRTGSTLLQGLLNSINGVLVRGENNDLFAHFWEAQKSLVMESGEYSSFFPNHPWFGRVLFDEPRWWEDLRRLARNYLLADQQDNLNIKCLGFKEIRFKGRRDELEGYLQFLEQLLPGCCFLFNTRDHEEVLKSAFYKNADHAVAKQKLLQLEMNFHSFAKDRSNCFEITYRDMKTRSPRLQEMFEFLGATYDAERVDLVFQTPHSYAPTQEDIQSLFQQN
ncbi:MAG: hypothetical protein ACPGYK_08860 [Flavobacteriales bacterium]